MSGTLSWSDVMGGQGQTQGQGSAPPPAPGVISWSDAMTPPANAKPAGGPAVGTFGQNMAAGAAEGIANTVNIASDPFGNLVGKPVELAATYLHDLVGPYFGVPKFTPQERAEELGDAVPQPGTRLMNTIAKAEGARLPSDVAPADGTTEALRAGLSSAVPGLVGGPAAAAVTGGAGVAANLAGQSAPDYWRPLVEAGVNTAAAGLGFGTVAAGRAALGAAGGKVADFARPILGKPAPVLDVTGRPILLSDISPDFAADPVMAKPGVAQIASKVVTNAATDPAAARTALDQASQIVPGSAPTSFQATQDAGLGGLEIAAKLKNGPLFVQRGLQQQAARQGLLQSAAGDADPAAVGQAARTMMENMQAQGEATVGGLRQQAQAATQNIGGQVPASADGATALQSFGSAMRAPIDAANTAAKANVSRLFDSWDPDGTAQFDMTGVRSGANKIAQGIGPNAAPPTGEEGAILARARLMPAVQSGSDFQDFYSRVGDLLRASRIDPAQAQTYRRMSMLMGFLHNAVEDTVTKAAEADPTVVDRMGALARGSGDQGAQSLAVGQGNGRFPGTQPEPQSAGAVGSAGAGRQANGRPGGLPGRSGIPAATRPGKPEGLVSFLTRNGGVYDDGGDLRAMGADKLRVGFLRKPPEGPGGGAQAGFGGGFGGFNSGNSKAGEPMQLDYAREKAIEAGYLPPGSDLTDFKTAIGEDLRGNSQYIPEDLANYHAARPGSDPRDEAAYDVARSRVLQAVDDMGTDLRGGEVDHATRLTALGVDPMEAVRQAGDAARLDYLGGKMFMDDAGVARGARQSGMAIDEPAQAGGGGFLTRDAADRLAAARAAHKDRVETFNRAPGVGAVLARGPTAGTFKMPEAAVPSAIWKAGSSGADRVSAYLRAGGDPSTVQDFAAFDLRKAAEKPDGTLDPAKYEAWAKSHSDALSRFPALRAKFETAAEARRTMDDAAARAASAQKDFQKSALARFTGDPEPARTVATILGAKDGPARMAQLVEQLKGEPAALAGLRHAVMQRYLPLIEGEGFRQFPAALSKEWLAAGKVLQPDQLGALRSIAADLRRSGSSISATKLPGGSDTMQKLAAADAHGQGSHGTGLQTILLATLLEGGGDVLAHATGVMGLKGAVMAGATTAGGLWANMLRQQGLRSVDNLVALAAAHPPLMRALLAKVPAKPTLGAVALLRQQVAATLRSAAIQRAAGLAQPTSGDDRKLPPVFPRVSAGAL